MFSLIAGRLRRMSNEDNSSAFTLETVYFCPRITDEYPSSQPCSQLCHFPKLCPMTRTVNNTSVTAEARQGLGPQLLSTTHRLLIPAPRPPRRLAPPIERIRHYLSRLPSGRVVVPAKISSTLRVARLAGTAAIVATHYAFLYQPLDPHPEGITVRHVGKSLPIGWNRVSQPPGLRHYLADLASGRVGSPPKVRAAQAIARLLRAAALIPADYLPACHPLDPQPEGIGMRYIGKGLPAWRNFLVETGSSAHYLG
jgi:hypothetical protein